jgi:hypothetical protein
MPQFTTISPTHIPGQKQAAWERFRAGNYVAIGWLNDVDLTGKSAREIEDLIRQRNYADETAAIRSFQRFLQLNPGDYVAVNNTNSGLFGIGIIESGYKFLLRKHDCGAGADASESFYPHYRDVKWKVVDYMDRSSLVLDGETSWQPYGTVGKISPTLPPYIQRRVGIHHQVNKSEKAMHFIRPLELEQVIKEVEQLQKEESHMERAHESLVEDFLVALKYAKHRDIKYRQGRVDIRIEMAGRSLLIVEVKAEWNLGFQSTKGLEAIRQAYNYAHDEGVRYVLVTNGDTYLLFDRLRGLSYKSNLLGEIQLTKLKEADLALIDRLRPERLPRPDFGETLQYLAESFMIEQ